MVKSIKDLNLKVSQNLLGIKGAKLNDIKLVYSHEQGILQSKDFLEKHNIKYKYYNNTATAAKLVKELNDIHVASISSKACSSIYDLAIIASDINQNETNTTRFIFICKDFKDNNVIKALNKIKNDSINLRILGNY